MLKNVTFTVTLMMKAKNEQEAIAIARSILGQRLEDAVEGEPESDGTELKGFEIVHVRKGARNRAADLFNALGGPCHYDNAILAFEKLVAEYAPAATGEDILGIMVRAYRSAKAGGTLGTLVNRDGEMWKEGER
ncbi:MAG: hypothetical protein ACHP78_01630 [Terriglobales bacterium]